MSDLEHVHPLEKLSAYIDDELPVDERAPVDAHLAACAACRAHLQALRHLAEALRTEAVPAISEGMEERIGRRLDEASVIPFRRRLAIPATIAATIGAVGLVAVLTWRTGGPKLSPAPTVVVPREAPAAPEPPTPPPPPGRAGKDADAKSKLEKQVTPELKEEAKKTVAPEPAPPSASEQERADNPVDEISAASGVVGGVVGGIEGGVPGAAEEDHVEAEENARRKNDASLARQRDIRPSAPAAAADRASYARAPECGGLTIDASVGARWEVVDFDFASRRIAQIATAHGGALQPPDPAAPAVLVLVIPAVGYDAFVADAKVVGVLDLEDARVPTGADCIRQRVTLRRVAVN